MYNDGIYFGKAQLSRLPLFDMERVELLQCAECKEVWARKTA